MQTQDSKQNFWMTLLLLFLGALPFVILLLVLPWMIG